MSRLDRHVAVVRGRLTFARFLGGLAWALLVFAVVVEVNLLVDRLLGYRVPEPRIWLLAGLGVSVIAAITYAIIVRPSKQEAAVAIDRSLGLKEKFSTALYARSVSGSDPFAAAAVRDAERTAAGVDLRGKFPLRFPRAGYSMLVLAGVVALTTQLAPQNLFGTPTQPVKRQDLAAQTKQATESIKQALATVESVPQSAKGDEKVALAKRELENALARAGRDPVTAQRTALKAQQDLAEAMKQKVKENQKFADATAAEKAFRSMVPPKDEKGPVADAHRALASGEYASALEDLQKAVENFDKMNDDERKKAADQMKNLAAQMQAMANNPQIQQQVQQQLQQAGANPQQARQMAKLMQQAAQGNPQAQQQLQQMQKQLQQQMNNGQGLTQQQQQIMQQLMQQAQAQANAQQQAQAMQQAAQQMAQAMQQAAQQGGQQNPNGQGKPPGNPQQQQQMANAQQQMQQQLGQMQAAAADLQQMQAAQQAAQGGARQAANGLNGNGQGDREGKNPDGSDKTGEWAQGDPAGKKGDGMGGPGIGNGGKAQKQAAPFTTKVEMSPSQENDKGKILASRYVKAGSFKGESKAGLQGVSPPSEQEVSDEVETDRVSGPARQAIKKYFEATTE